MFFEILLANSVTTSSVSFNEFDSRDTILFQIKVFDRDYAKET